MADDDVASAAFLLGLFNVENWLPHHDIMRRLQIADQGEYDESGRDGQFHF